MKQISKTLIFFLMIAGLQAQEDAPLFDLQSPKYETSMQQLLRKRGVTTTLVSQVLEAELEEENYLVGPGDIFELLIFGDSEKKIEFSVLPEGSALIPTIGELKISGLTLKEAKNQIIGYAQKYYISGEKSVHLKGLRKFTVYLTGEIENPGTYFVQGSDRLSTALELSGQGQQFQQNTGELATTGIRDVLTDWAEPTRIEIRHGDGTIDTLDLTLFYRAGDKSQNPYLKGGDLVYVPPIDLTENYVIIDGNVGRQGVYQLKANETLVGFLNRVGAFSKRSNLEQVVLLRGKERNELDILNEEEKYSELLLEDKDRIIIPTIHDKVYVRGEVFQPGSFPYYANYTALDYIGLAGALDSADDYEDIVVIRLESGKAITGSGTIVKKGDTVIIPKRAREVFKDYMVILSPILSIIVATLALTK